MGKWVSERYHREQLPALKQINYVRKRHCKGDTETGLAPASEDIIEFQLKQGKIANKAKNLNDENRKAIFH